MKSMIYEDVTFYYSKKGKKRLDNLVEKSGAPSSIDVLYEATMLYAIIVENREPDESVTVHIGDKKHYDAKGHFDFDEEIDKKNSDKKTDERNFEKIIDITSHMK